MPIKLSAIIKDPKDIPSLPAVFNRIMSCAKNPENSLKELEEAIQHDPSLTVQILKLTNSSFYGFSQKVETLSHALGIIGTEQLTNLVMGMMVIDQFDGIPEKYVTMESFWAHSIACGIAAKEIAALILPDKREEMYLAGMLHDIGSLILYKHLPQKAEVALDYCNDWGMKLSDAERIVFDFNHAELGAHLFENWELPEIFSQTIRYHHSPNKAKKYSIETAIVHLADYITMNNCLGSSGEFQDPYLNPHILNKLNLPAGSLATVSEKTIDSFEEIFNIYFEREPVG